jgi:hypothetical protein
MGNKHSKQEYINLLNIIGDYLWKLVLKEYEEKQDEIIEHLEYKLNIDEEDNFIFNCKEFNPMHYLIISSFWLPTNTFRKLCKLAPNLIDKCKYERTHNDTKLLVFQNNNHVSNVNLDFIKMEKVKISLQRRGTMDNNSQSLYEIRKKSLTQFKEDINSNTIQSYTDFNPDNNSKKLKVPPPVRRHSEIKDKKELDRPVTYYILSDEEKKSFDDNIDKYNQSKDQITKRVSSKMLWFKYALFNKNLWEQEPPSDGIVESIDIGEIGYLSLISLLQIKYAKFSSIKNYSDNLTHLYKIIMNHNIHKQRRKSSIKDKLKNIFVKS